MLSRRGNDADVHQVHQIAIERGQLIGVLNVPHRCTAISTACGRVLDQTDAARNVVIDRTGATLPTAEGPAGHRFARGASCLRGLMLAQALHRGIVGVARGASDVRRRLYARTCGVRRVGRVYRHAGGIPNRGRVGKPVAVAPRLLRPSGSTVEVPVSATYRLRRAGTVDLVRGVFAVILALTVAPIGARESFGVGLATERLPHQLQRRKACARDLAVARFVATGCGCRALVQKYNCNVHVV
mmetsp:Transcript_3937/g.4432  ORF Transcript_3937/g.4432 Transcript_3937/m.4432 type:complete len:242 (-) Transcript_3937:807-1532(-)